MFSSKSDNIDWALIAYNWIQMQKNGGNKDPSSMPLIPPPPPNISGHISTATTSLNTFSSLPISRDQELVAVDEKGEADMVLSDEEDAVKNEPKNCVCVEAKDEPLRPVIHLSEENATIMQPMHPSSQWYMQNTLSPFGKDNMKEIDCTASTSSEPISEWTAWPNHLATTSSALGQTGLQSISNPTAHIPSLMKLSVPNPNNTSHTIASNDNISDEVVCTTNMDAAKRKMLPAWIREGLEKMERAKQKEREQNLLSQPDNETTNHSSSSIHKVTVTSNTIVHSASDSSGNEDDGKDDIIDNESIYRRKDAPLNVGRSAEAAINHGASMTKIVGARDGDTDSDIDAIDDPTGNNSNTDTAHVELSGKSYEKRLADLMIVVRRTLTELLLEVTNEEISHLANDAVKSYKTKASSSVSVMIRNSALSSITGKLGLAAYADTSSSDEENSDIDDENNDGLTKLGSNEFGTDSEEELKSIIKARHRTWVKISNEIEEELTSLAEREEHQLKYHAKIEQQHHQQDDDEPTTSGGSSTVGKTYDKDFGETTETKLPYSNGSRRQKGYDRKERTSRFSDNKDTSNSGVTSIAYITQNMPQHPQQQQHHIATAAASLQLFSDTQTMEKYNGNKERRTSTNRGEQNKANKAMCSAIATSLDSGHIDKSARQRERECRRRHTAKHTQRPTDRSDCSKGKKNDTSLSTTASSSTSSTTSSSSSNDTDIDSSSSSNSRTSVVKHKKRKRHISKESSRRSDRERRNSHRSLDRDYRHRHSKSSKSSRHEQLDRSDYLQHKKHRQHNRRRRRQNRSSDSDERSESRSRSRSSYASSSRHYHRR